MISPQRALADLDPRNALLWTEFSTQFDAATGPSLLVDGGMEAAGIANFAAFGTAVVTKQGNAYAGAQCLRCARDAGSGIYGAAAGGVTVGVDNVVTGFARSNGTSPPRVVLGNGPTWIGTTSTDWQPFRIEGNPSGGTVVYLGSSTNGYVEFDNVALYPKKRFCDNLGRYPGAPRLLTMGDGTTAATIPQQITGRHGLVFTGTQYVDTGIVDPFERTDRFSWFVMTQGPMASAAKSVGNLLCTLDSAQNSRGWRAYISNTGVLYTQLISTSPANSIDANVSVGNALTGHNSIAFTYAGSSSVAGLSAYKNGQLLSLSASANSLSTTIKSGKPIIIGAQHSGAGVGNFCIGTVTNAMIFPWELTAQQVQYLHRQCMTRINARTL